MSFHNAGTKFESLDKCVKGLSHYDKESNESPQIDKFYNSSSPMNIYFGSSTQAGANDNLTLILERKSHEL